jgi:hypothetical protein
MNKLCAIQPLQSESGNGHHVIISVAGQAPKISLADHGTDTAQLRSTTCTAGQRSVR